MPKITFMGAGSSVFAKNVLGDCMTSPIMENSEIALYDIDADRMDDSKRMLDAINRNLGNKATIKTYLGVENRKDALRGANYVVNAIQVGLYRPCTVTDFEVPKKYGLRQTIADTLGIGGIFRALRTIPVMQDFADDMAEVCPNAWFLNYTNPMAMLTGYMQRYTPIKTVGLCHSVQVCASHLLKGLDMPYDDTYQWKIAGINHQAWLLEIRDPQGNDLYPEIKRRAAARTEKHDDMVRYELMKRFGYYVTESSEHNAEYTPYFIKDKYPELIERFNIPLDEYPRRCIKHEEKWATLRVELTQNDKLTLHTARGKDLWFHVQKAPGSHVVVMSRGEDIPDTTRQEAAELAVIYSSAYKAGTGAKVAVDTTEVKNIWKANGAKPGMVLYEVYTTVYVTPREKLLDELKANAKK